MEHRFHQQCWAGKMKCKLVKMRWKKYLNYLEMLQEWPRMCEDRTEGDGITGRLPVKWINSFIHIEGSWYTRDWIGAGTGKNWVSTTMANPMWEAYVRIQSIRDRKIWDIYLFLTFSWALLSKYRLRKNCHNLFLWYGLIEVVWHPTLAGTKDDGIDVHINQLWHHWMQRCWAGTDLTVWQKLGKIRK